MEKDPQELHNLFGDFASGDDSAGGELAERMSSRLESWRCQDPKPKAYQDLDAKQIDRPNVPPRDLSHRSAVIEYFQLKMAALQQ